MWICRYFVLFFWILINFGTYCIPGHQASLYLFVHLFFFNYLPWSSLLYFLGQIFFPILFVRLLNDKSIPSYLLRINCKQVLRRPQRLSDVCIYFDKCKKATVFHIVRVSSFYITLQIWIYVFCVHASASRLYLSVFGQVHCLHLKKSLGCVQCTYTRCIRSRNHRPNNRPCIVLF